jgi:hypothetical protein
LAYAMYDDATEGEVGKLVAARMQRQAPIKAGKACNLCFVVEETVLRRSVGHSGEMYRQLRHIEDLVRHHNVLVQIVPLSAGAHPGAAGPFVILEFGDKPALLYLEQHGSSAFLEQQNHVAAARKALRRLRSVALSCEDSVDLIVSLSNEMLNTDEEPQDGGLGPRQCSLAQEHS